MPAATVERSQIPTSSKRTFLAVVFASLLVGILLVPIWLVKYPPLLDYPNHLARTFVLAHLHNPAYRFDQFYAADWGVYPYLAMDVSLLGLQKFLPIELAGRIYLSFCALAVPLGAWFFLQQVNPGQDHLALWTLVNSYTIFFLYGFLNFHLSVALCFLALGLWLRFLDRPSLARWCLALVAFTILYFAHILGLGIAGLVVTAYSLLARRGIREILFSWLLFLPGAVFYLHSSRVAGRQTNGFTFHGFGEKVDSLSACMHGYSTRLDQITLLALALFFLAAWWRNRDFHWNHRWLGVTAILFAVYWALPWGYGEGSDLDIRVLPVVFVLVLTVARIGSRGWRLAPIALLLFAVRTTNVVQNFKSAQPELAGLAQSFAATSANARVLPIVEADEDDPIRHPFAHFWAYGVIQRGWFSPYLFDTKGLLPLRIKHDSYTLDGFWDLVYKESPDWSQVQQDYDYVWAYNVPRFSDGLASIGHLVYEDGDLQVFRLNTPPDFPSAGRSREMRDSGRVHVRPIAFRMAVQPSPAVASHGR